MAKDIIISELQAAINEELHNCLDRLLIDYPSEYIAMMNYQLGWHGENNGLEAQGKRIRPLLVLLANHACGGDWHKALPVAAAVELVHNFSLIHDDIQDCSETRRGRNTVWVEWGNAQAINAGDAMLTIAHLSILELNRHFDAEVVNQATNLVQSACLKLTRGQFLDIAFEHQNDLPIDLYWQMVEGKTGALLAACLGLGSLASLADATLWHKLMDFGSKIGAAFQVQDDWLGIWGNDELTGKSAVSDLITRKKTYPVLLGIQNKKDFYREWHSLDTVSVEDARRLAGLLENEGCGEKTTQKFESLYSEAFELLDSMALDDLKVKPLKQVIKGLFGRNK